MTDYRVSLDIYSGPLDLLLYLIKREELDIYDIPIARIADQYVEYLGLLHQIDPNVAGEFLVLASALMEIKIRSLLPRPVTEDGQEEDLGDPRLELVRQLLEYKKFKDAARQLAHTAEEQRRRFARVPVLPDGKPADEVDLEDVQIWDLVNAFHRLLAQTGRALIAHEVVYDDTPIDMHVADIVDRLEREGGCITFQSVFEARSRGEMIGVFLALLELIRQKLVRIEQDRLFGQIYLFQRSVQEAEALRRAEEEQVLAYQQHVRHVQEAQDQTQPPEEPAADVADGEDEIIVPQIGETALEVPDEPRGNT